MNKKFRKNKYTNLYFSIINKRKTNSIDKDIYTENHHIIPRCLNGSDDKENIVALTAREHYICHRLLPKMVKLNSREYFKLWHAFAMLCWCNNEIQKRHYKITSRVYELCKCHLSIRMKEKVGELNSSWGTKWIYNIDLKLNKKIPKEEPIPKGWYLGRVLKTNWKPPKIKRVLCKRQCKQCNSEFMPTRLKQVFCGKKCAQRYFYENTPTQKMQRDEKIIDVRPADVPSYKKCGFEIIN